MDKVWWFSALAVGRGIRYSSPNATPTRTQPHTWGELVIGGHEMSAYTGWYPKVQHLAVVQT